MGCDHIVPVTLTPSVMTDLLRSWSTAGLNAVHVETSCIECGATIRVVLMKHSFGMGSGKDYTHVELFSGYEKPLTGNEHQIRARLARMRLELSRLELFPWGPSGVALQVYRWLPDGHHLQEEAFKLASKNDGATRDEVDRLLDRVEVAVVPPRP